jgi:hypothetical protein
MARKRLGRRQRLKAMQVKLLRYEQERRAKLASGGHVRSIWDDHKGIGGVPTPRGQRAQSAKFWTSGIRPAGAQV